MKKANNADELIMSIKDGRFTLDSSHLTVDGYFSCSNKQLISLIGGPKEVGGNFGCSNNKLTSLEGAPEKVDGSFNCANNNLTSLEGAPKEVGDNFNCTYNRLTSLVDGPKEVGGDFSCSVNRISSLHNIHKHINKIGNIFRCTNNPIKEAILGLLLIEELKAVKINPTIDSIVNKYLPSSNKASLYKCAQDLVKAGFPELATL